MTRTTRPLVLAVGLMTLSAGAPAERSGSAHADLGVRTLELRSLGHVGGSVTSLARSGDHTYAVAGMRLLVLEFSASGAPARVKHQVQLREPGEIVVGDGLLYLVEDGYLAEDGIQLVDVSDPVRPSLRGRVGLPGEQRDAIAIGDTVFVDGNQAGGPRIIEVSDPDDPIERGQLDIDRGGGISRLATVDGRLITVRIRKSVDLPADPALIVVDVGDVDSPRITAELPLLEMPRGLVTDGARLIVEGAITGADRGLLAIDMSVVDSPTLVGYSPRDERAMPIGIHGETAWIWETRYRPSVVMTLVRAHLKEWPNLTFDEPMFVAPESRASVVPYGDRVLIAGGYRGVYSIGEDGSDVAILPTLGEAGRPAVGNGRLWAADADGEVWSLVLDEPDAEPRLIAGLAEPFPDDVPGVNAYASDDMLVLAIPRHGAQVGGFSVFDISDPEFPLLVRAWADARVWESSGGGSSVDSDGARILVVNGGAVTDIDLGDPSAPRERRFDAGSYCRSAALVGRHAWLACGESVIGVDLEASSGEIAEIGRHTYSGPSRLELIAANARAVLVSDHVNGLRVLDVEDPSSPTPTRTLTGLEPTSLAFVEGDAWVTEGSSLTGYHTRVYDLSDLRNPLQRARKPGLLPGIVASEGLVFSSDPRGNGIERFLIEEGDVVDPRRAQALLPRLARNH